MLLDRTCVYLGQDWRRRCSCTMWCVPWAWRWWPCRRSLSPHSPWPRSLIPRGDSESGCWSEALKIFVCCYSATSLFNLDSSQGPEPELMHINICLQLTVRKAEALIGGFPLPGPTWHSYLASSPCVAFTTYNHMYRWNYVLTLIYIGMALGQGCTWRLYLPSVSFPRTKYRSKPGRCLSKPKVI